MVQPTLWSTSLWSTPFYGPPHSMVHPILWSTSLYGQPVLWSTSFYGPAHSMLNLTVWSTPLYGPHHSAGLAFRNPSFKGGLRKNVCGKPMLGAWGLPSILSGHCRPSLSGTFLQDVVNQCLEFAIEGGGFAIGVEGLPLQPLGVEGLPLGWRVCHWGGGFAIGLEGLPLGWRVCHWGGRFDTGAIRVG